MVDFAGFEEGKTQWKFIYERQTVGVTSIVWKDDKSGDFISASKKLGALRIWNVASKEPKALIKVGA